ncbi:hypothetical protein AWN76_009900 [Rhodothermaceae bacterium RA]|nr:hypothetical protein AWN76_009900 [Rhodothermaceae bacterium RA]
MTPILSRMYAAIGARIIHALHEQYDLSPDEAVELLKTVTPVLIQELRERLDEPARQARLLASLQTLPDEPAIPPLPPGNPSPSQMHVITMLMGAHLAPLARRLAAPVGLDKATTVRAIITTLYYLLEHLKGEIRHHSNLAEVLR